MCAPKEGQGPAEASARYWTTPVFILSGVQFVGFFGGAWTSGISGILGIAAGVVTLNAHPGRAGATNYMTASVLLCFVNCLNAIGIISGYLLVLWLEDIDCEAADLDESQMAACESRGGIGFLRQFVIVGMCVTGAGVLILCISLCKCLRARDACMRASPDDPRHWQRGLQLQNMPPTRPAPIVTGVAVPSAVPVHTIVAGTALPQAVLGTPAAGGPQV